MDPLKSGGLRPLFKEFLKIRGQNREGRRPLFGVFFEVWFFRGVGGWGRPPPLAPVASFVSFASLRAEGPEGG